MPGICDREKRCVGGGIVGHVVTVAARSRDVLAADFRRIEAEHQRDRFGGFENALAVGLDRQRPVIGERGDGRRGTDRGMHVIRPFVGRLDDFGRRARGAGRLVHDFLVAGRRAEQPVENALMARQVVLDVPLRLPWPAPTDAS